MANKRQATFGVVLLLIVVPFQGLYAQSITGRVESITATAGNSVKVPADGLKVVVESKGGKSFGATFTDYQGRFQLQQIPATKSPYTFKIYSGKKELYKKSLVVDRDLKFKSPITVQSASSDPKK
jgi:hypothetical protein